MTHRRGVAPWSYRRGTAAGPVNGDSEATTRRPGRPRWRSASPGPRLQPLGEVAGGSRRFRFPESRVPSPAAPYVLGVAHRPAGRLRTRPLATAAAEELARLGERIERRLADGQRASSSTPACRDVRSKAAPGLGRAHQPRDRPGAVPQPTHHRHARAQRPDQARLSLPHRGDPQSGGARPAPEPALSALARKFDHVSGKGSVPRQNSLSSAPEMAAQMCRTGARGWLSSGSGVAQPPRCW
jgi:hypothetical protein